MMANITAILTLWARKFAELTHTKLHSLSSVDISNHRQFLLTLKFVLHPHL
jgi:hypothetical protein